MESLETPKKSNFMKEKIVASKQNASPRKASSGGDSQQSLGTSSQREATDMVSSLDDAIDEFAAAKGCGIPFVSGNSHIGSPFSPPRTTNKRLLKLFGKGAPDQVLETHAACMDALNSLIAMAAEKEQEIIELHERLAKNEEDLDLERRKALLHEMERRDLEDLVDWQRQELEGIEQSAEDESASDTDSVTATDSENAVRSDADSQSLDETECAIHSDSPNQLSNQTVGISTNESNRLWVHRVNNNSRSLPNIVLVDGAIDEKENVFGREVMVAKHANNGSELKELKREIEQQRLAHERAVCAWNESETQNLSLKERLSATEQKMRVLVAENFELRLGMDEKRGSTDKNRELSERLSLAEDRVKVLYRENQQMKTVFDDKKAVELKNFELKEQLKSSEERYKLVAIENSRLETELENYKSEMECEGAILLEQVQRAEQYVKELLSENKELRSENLSKGERGAGLEINSLLMDKKNLMNEIDSQRKIISEKDEKLEQYRQDLESLLQDREMKVTEMGKLRMQVMELMSELARQSEILNRKSAGLDRLQEKEKISREESVQLKKKAELAIEENEKLGEKMSGLLESLGQIFAAVTDGYSHKGSATSVPEDREALKLNILDITEQITAMKLKLGTRHLSFQEVEEKNRVLILKSSKLEDENEELHVEIAKFDAFLARIAETTAYISCGSDIRKVSVVGSWHEDHGIKESMLESKKRILEACFSLRRRLNDTVEGPV